VTKHRAFAFIAALLAGLWAVNAGARTPEAASSASVTAVAALAQWKAGTNYQLLAAPQPTSVPAGKIEVNEIFWYGCGHCYALDPTLESWRAGKPDFIEFVRIPVIWGQAHRQHAKLYYTLQALHRPELHSKVFDAIHRDGIMLAARDDLEARAQHRAFLAAEGVSEKDFDAAYDSMSVASNVLRAEDLTKKYAVGNVPVMIVNGRYSTSVSEAGGATQLLSLINDLAASEKNR
jgi:protein dithiol oxidoreductase (disulfide-forming)